MQYKNLNSLGRAYRAGNVDRSTYIKQRRRIIDDFTKPVDEEAEDITVISPHSEFDEAATIVSTAADLAERDGDEESLPKVANDYLSGSLLPAVLFGLMALAIILFFYVRQ